MAEEFVEEAAEETPTESTSEESSEEAEAEIEVDVNAVLLEVMVERTTILERLAKGEMPLSEAEKALQSVGAGIQEILTPRRRRRK